MLSAALLVAAAAAAACAAQGWWWLLGLAALLLALLLALGACVGRTPPGPSDAARAAAQKHWRPLPSGVVAEFGVSPRTGRPAVAGILPHEVPVRVLCDYSVVRPAQRGRLHRCTSELGYRHGADGTGGGSVCFADELVEATVTPGERTPGPCSHGEAGAHEAFAPQLELVVVLQVVCTGEAALAVKVHNVRVELELEGPAFHDLDAVQMLRNGFSTFTKTAALAASRADEVGLGYCFPFIPRILAGVCRNIDSPFFGSLEPCSEHYVCFSAGGREGLLLGFARQNVALGSFRFDRRRRWLSCNLDYDGKTLHAKDAKTIYRDKDISDKDIADLDAPRLTLQCEPLVIGRGDIDSHVEAFIRKSRGAAGGEALRVPGAGVNAGQPAPVGWCSWYELGTEVSAEALTRNTDDIIQRHSNLGVRYIQLDDGYQQHIGDWLLVNGIKFTSPPDERKPWSPSKPPKVSSSEGLRGVAQAIVSRGLLPGIWLAPFLGGSRSQLYRRHPEWFLRCDQVSSKHIIGHINPDWSSDWGIVYVLDFTHPGAKEWLKMTFATLRDYGFRYFKLDFLNLGLKRGGRYNPSVSRVEAFRSALRLIVDTVGTDSYVVGCGAPLACTTGFVDACRISGDVSANWENPSLSYLCGHGVAIPSAKWALQASLVRSFYQQQWWLNDPDCLLVRCEHWSDLQVQTVCTIIGLSSGTCFLSDDLTRLRAHADRRLAMVRKILPPSTTVFGKITASELMKQELPNHFACYPTISKASGVGGNACAGQQSTTAVHALINWTARTAPATAAAASGIGCSADTTHRLDKGKPQRRRPNGAASLPSAQHYFDVWNERLLLETDLAKLALGPYQTLALQVTEQCSVGEPVLVGTSLNLLSLTDGRLVGSFERYDENCDGDSWGDAAAAMDGELLGRFTAAGSRMCETHGRIFLALPRIGRRTKVKVTAAASNPALASTHDGAAVSSVELVMDGCYCAVGIEVEEPQSCWSVSLLLSLTLGDSA